MFSATLRVLSGYRAGESIPVRTGKLLVGREEDCHLRPDSEFVSRHHCVILLDDYTLRVRDLGSRNGTFVNGRRLGVGETILLHDDIVSIGEMIIQVDLTQPTEAVDRSNGFEEAALWDFRSDTDPFESDTIQASQPAEVRVEGGLSPNAGPVLPNEAEDPGGTGVVVSDNVGGDSESSRIDSAVDLAAHPTSGPSPCAAPRPADLSLGHEELDDDTRKEAERIRGQLEIAHVFYAEPWKTRIQELLSSRNRELLGILGRDFNRSIVVDARDGLNPAGTLDEDLLQRDLLIRMAEAFGQVLDADLFNPMEIAIRAEQEPASLFCFLNVQLIQPIHFKHLRGLGFGQNQHRLLWCGPSEYLRGKSYLIE
jgi:hypothetical protein